MGVVYLAYCGSWQLSLHVPCFCAFYIFNTTPNPTSSSFFQNFFVLVLTRTIYSFHNVTCFMSYVTLHTPSLTLVQGWYKLESRVVLIEKKTPWLLRVD